ncbi:HesB/IscA family protein [Buchnera aphidicola]|uniref:HesB/IscA family protein n=1 Tax=Buchnera aphidicola TaxID=9 RepID=UPI003BEEC1EF
MKVENINIQLFNPKKIKNITITETAIKQITFLLNLDVNNKGIRIGIKKSGCAGFRYTMEIVKKEKKEDIITSINNILIYINTDHIHIIDGIKIDFIKNNINKIFKFYNKKFNHLCGCGESFSMNMLN